MWHEGLFVLDTNVLLNLYRYSDHAREELVEVFHSIEERLWLPYQVAEEYISCRLDVIHEKRKAYEDLQKTLEEGQAKVAKQMQELHRDPVVEAEDLLEEVWQSF
jgi:predicted nucleic acid-binding protein